MAKSYASAVIPGGIDQVWQIVRDFDGLPGWHPGIASSEIEDGRPAAEIGCIRHLTLGDGSTVREQLVTLDDVDNSCTYTMLDGPFPVRSYRATIRLSPITVTGRTFVEWYADYDAEAMDEPKLDKTFTVDVFTTGLNALHARFES